MEWIFENNRRRDRSMAGSAQRVVQDMHQEINKQKDKISQLEKVIFKFNNMCTESLEYDLKRLENRKLELIQELSKTDNEILETQERLRLVKSEVERVISPIIEYNNNHNNNHNTNTITNSNHNGKQNASKGKKNSHSNTNNNNNQPSKQNQKAITHHILPSTLSMSLLDEQHIEETELYESIRDVGGRNNVLFIIHLNSSADVFLYRHQQQQHGSLSHRDNSSNEDDVLVNVTKITDVTHLSNSLIELSPYEKLMAYGAKIVPNHERDFPDILEIPLPASLLVSTLSLHSHHSQSQPQYNNNNNSYMKTIGVLIGAFEIPLLPGVIIDVWEETPMIRSQSKPQVLSDSDGTEKLPSTSTSSTSSLSSSALIPPSSSSSVVAVGNNNDNNNFTPRYWATTPVDGIGFVVLERVYIESSSSSSNNANTNNNSGNNNSDTNDNNQQQHQVEANIFGRHPAKGMLLLERIGSSDV